MWIAVAHEPVESRFVAWRTSGTAIPEASGDVLIAQDERMLSDWDEHGYELPDSIVGPFAVFYRPCPATQFPALVQRDPYARDPAHQFEPCPVTVVGVGLWLVTIARSYAIAGSRHPPNAATPGARSCGPKLTGHSRSTSSPSTP